MNLKQTLPRGLAVLALALAAGPLLVAADNSDNSTARPTKKVTTADRAVGQSSDDIIGQDVKSTTGQDLGEVQDLVVDLKSGQIVYALISTGGFLGMGETLHALPISTFTSGRTGDSSALTVDLKGADFKGAPTIKKDQLATLVGDQRGQDIYRYYQQDWPRGVEKSARENNRLLRVSKLNGMEVRNNNRDVGDVDDVIVDFQRHRALALVDPNDDYTGTDRNLAIAFNQLSASMTDEDVLETKLTQDDFRKAAPLAQGGDIMDASYPFVWGYGYRTGVGYTMNGDLTPMNDTTDRTPISRIRRSLRDDPATRDVAQNVQLSRRGDKLVISGQVRSEDMKEKVADKVSDFARGWDIDNRVSVSAATE